MTDADQHDSSGKTAERNEQPVGGELPHTGQQALFIAQPNADRQDLFGDPADRSQQPIGGVTPGAGKEDPWSANLATEKQDYLEKLRQEHREYLARLEANRHDHSGETTEENLRPSGVEMADAAPQQSVNAVQDAAPQENFGEIAGGRPQPIGGEASDAGEEEPSGVKLGAEQLDYLDKLEAEHQARLAQVEAERQKALSDSAQASTQSIAEPPVPVPQESFAAAQDAPPQEHASETAEEMAQPVVSEMPDAFPQYSFAAAQDAPPQEHASETAEEMAQPIVSEMPDAFPQYSFADAQDPLPQEHAAETSEPFAQPVSSATPDAFPQYSFAEAQEAPPQEHVPEASDQFAQPVVSESPVAGQQERADTALGAEQLDYLAKLEAEHQDYLAKLEAARQSHSEPIAGQPESTVGSPPLAGILPPGESPEPIEILPPVQPVPPGEPARPPSNAAVTIVVIGIVMGVLFGGVIAAITWHQTKPAASPAAVAAAPDSGISRAPRDLASVDSSTVGLSGHLSTKWDGKLNYDFVVTPDDPSRQAQFDLMVSDPPRPLSMTIELKNNYGFILCSREAVLKFDPVKAAAEQKTQGDSSPPSAVDEAAREKDKDVFQNQTGADGKLASIRAQGEIPCPAEAYANFAYWSFTPNFPDITEQDQLLQDKLDAAAAAAPRHSERRRARTAKTH